MSRLPNELVVDIIRYSNIDEFNRFLNNKNKNKLIVKNLLNLSIFEYLIKISINSLDNIERNESSQLKKIPNELLFGIVGYLDTEDIVNLVHVDKELNEVIGQSKEYWKSKHNYLIKLLNNELGDHPIVWKYRMSEMIYSGRHIGNGHTFAINYNAIRIFGGMGGLAFSN